MPLPIRRRIAAVLLALAACAAAMPASAAEILRCVEGARHERLLPVAMDGHARGEFLFLGPGRFRLLLSAPFHFHARSWILPERGRPRPTAIPTPAAPEGRGYVWSWGARLEGEDRRLSLQITPSLPCPGCRISATVETRGCAWSPPPRRRTPCPPGYCFEATPDLFGRPSCLPRRGWDGSRCP